MLRIYTNTRCVSPHAQKLPRAPEVSIQLRTQLHIQVSGIGYISGGSLDKNLHTPVRRNSAIMAAAGATVGSIELNLLSTPCLPCVRVGGEGKLLSIKDIDNLKSKICPSWKLEPNKPSQPVMLVRQFVTQNFVSGMNCL